MKQGELWDDLPAIEDHKKELSDSYRAKQSRRLRKKNPQWALFQNLRSKTIRLGKVFSVLFHEIDWRNDCFYGCGRAVIYSYGTGERGGMHEDSASIDCVITTAGHVKNNVVISCMRCNRIKNDGTANETLSNCKWNEKIC